MTKTSRDTKLNKSGERLQTVYIKLLYMPNFSQRAEINQLSTFSEFRNFTHMTSIRHQHPPSAARDLGRTVQRIIVEQNRL